MLGQRDVPRSRTRRCTCAGRRRLSHGFSREGATAVPARTGSGGAQVEFVEAPATGVPARPPTHVTAEYLPAEPGWSGEPGRVLSSATTRLIDVVGNYSDTRGCGAHRRGTSSVSEVAMVELGGDITPRGAVVVGTGISSVSMAWFLRGRGGHDT